MKQKHNFASGYDLGIHARNLTLETKSGRQLLDIPSLDILQGEFVDIRGNSGAGKSLLATALTHIRFNEEEPSIVSKGLRASKEFGAKLLHQELENDDEPVVYDGEVYHMLRNRDSGWEEKLNDSYNIAAKHIGFTAQQPTLFPHMTVQKNVELNARLSDIPVDTAMLEKAYDTLDIRQLLGRKAAKLSGGERQRVAIARSLAKGPNALILDEPTSALHRKSRDDINGMLKDLAENIGITVVSVSHDDNSLATRAIQMQDGMIISDTKQK